MFGKEGGIKGLRSLYREWISAGVKSVEKCLNLFSVDSSPEKRSKDFLLLFTGEE